MKMKLLSLLLASVAGITIGSTSFADVTFAEDETSMAYCGALSQMSSNRTYDIGQLEKEILAEISKKNSGAKNDLKLFELTDKLETLRVEIRQLDIELRTVCK